MATKSIAWTTGTGNITLSYTGQGNDTVVVTSDENDLYVDRSQTITFATTAGSPTVTQQVTVTQKGKPEVVDYLKFTALESGTFTLSIGRSVTVANFEYVEYSTNDGTSWTRTDNVANTTVTITTPTIAAGNSVLWRGSGVRIGSTSTSNTAANNSIFSSTGQCNVSGDIRTLLGLNKPNNLTISTYIYKYLFLNMSKLKDASELIMPSTTNTNCFYGMFVSCTGLTKPPSLPATDVAGSAYRMMFSACTSLTSVPALPAETLGTYCYASMFNACSSLVTAQTTLPATTLNNYCYSGMFYDCTSLTSVPSLPATTLNSYCYSEMFRGCTSLTTAPTLSSTELNTSCYAYMFYGCSALTSAPALPATTMKTNCYQYMFGYCTSLATAPTLPATTLVSGCYNNMFYLDSSLNYIKALFTTTPSSSYTNNWVRSVKSTGTFVKNINATWTDTGNSAVPTNWTVIYYDTSDSKYYKDKNKSQECDDHGNPI